MWEGRNGPNSSTSSEPREIHVTAHSGWVVVMLSLCSIPETLGSQAPKGLCVDVFILIVQVSFLLMAQIFNAEDTPKCQTQVICF